MAMVCGDCSGRGQSCSGREASAYRSGYSITDSRGTSNSPEGQRAGGWSSGQPRAWWRPTGRVGRVTHGRREGIRRTEYVGRDSVFIHHKHVQELRRALHPQLKLLAPLGRQRLGARQGASSLVAPAQVELYVWVGRQTPRVGAA
eukprot:scaffold26500_cov101-Isochrysis_galbana.AAC.3